MKKVLVAFVMLLGMALPAQAEVNGVYMGIKFLDSIQSNGDVSRNFAEASLPLDTFSQNSVGGALFVGYDFYPTFQVPVRAELEFAIRSMIERERESIYSVGGTTQIHDSMKYQAYTQTLFANVYYDFHNSTAFTPYIGAGIGLGFIQNSLELSTVAYYDGQNMGGEVRNASAYSTVFAWNIGVGCAYAFNENVSLDLSYRYVGFGETSSIGYADDPDGPGPSGTETHSYTTVPNAHEFALGLRLTF